MTTKTNMPKRLRISVATVLAIGLLPLLAACGGSDDGSGAGAGSAAGNAANGSTTNDSTTNADGAVQLTIPDGVDDYTKKLYITENVLAACMKKQGFTYTPHVGTPPSDDGFAGIDGLDYAVAKKSRAKYGFGNYAATVYPDDPNAPGSNAGGKQGGKVVTAPDNDEKGLTPAQQEAYSTALYGPPAATKAEEKTAGCELEASEAVNGPALSAAEEKQAWEAKQEANRANGLELNGDTQLVQLAQEFAACLRAQGIPVSTTQPTGMADMVRLGQQTPENIRSMTKEEALPLLTKEIDISLKDLECGKKFRAAYFPKEKAHPYWGEGA
ncbi:hypothetical protein ACOT81_36220 [Streptomyces sp. WI04-05B]|uniref:hypothetical protein n=1 Tax=Streptomyces TaxID=1883 RepID=UPI0029B1514E|nr:MULTISPECIES: hypothetical protein [unclassified Streptomyces]MDX2546344.1 hypothetical protein [Streptomyces sp. WI04-05B]MDX2589203.1 hypothetical protein [Streptomyces sp. WI04-05A]